MLSRFAFWGFVFIITVLAIYALVDDTKHCIRHEQRGYVLIGKILQPNIVCVERNDR
jgi:hypothetical protein